ncbi:MAG: ABC transporter permease [Nocardioidaceae bacterium]
MTTTSAPGPGNRRLLEKATFLGPGLLFTLVFVAVPLLLVLSYTVFERGRFGGVLYEFNLDNFTRALEPTYRKVLVSSIWIAGLATVLALLLGYPVAYAIAKMPARLRTVALVLVVVPFWTNFLIRTYAWIMLLNTQGMLNDALISLGLVDEPIRLLYTKGAVVTGLVYAYLPLMILPIYASVARLDPELREASANLGANRFTTFLRVTLPLSLPGVVTGCIFVFVPSMGNFVIPELLGGGKTVMVGNLIRDQFLKARDWPFGATLALIMVVFLVGLFAVQSLVSRRFATEVDR